MKGRKKITGVSITVLVMIVVAYNASTMGLASEEFNIIETIETDTENKFKVELKQGMEKYEKTSPDTRLKVVETPENRTETLKTDNKELEIYEDSEKTLKTVQTPYGKLEKGLKDGRTVENFQGQQKEEIKDFKQKAEEKLSRELRSAQQLKEQAIQEHLKNIELEISREENNTYFKIQNNEDQTINIQNWRIEGKESETGARDAEHRFQENKISGGENLKIYTEQENQIEEDNYIESEELHIYNEESTRGDTVVLYDNWGNTVQNKTY